jgi:O-succinylbenzoic acid--CoA ligase
MTSLAVLDAADVAGVTSALGAALNGAGPAVLVRDARAARLAGEGTDPFADLELPEGTALLIQTSGSTGTPKTVLLSADALRASSAAVTERLGGPGQWLLALPLTYIAGLSVLVRSAAAGIAPALLSRGPFDAQGFIDAVATMTGERRYTSLVPVQLIRVLELCENDVTASRIAQSLDAILIGGQMLESELRARAERAGLSVVETYGSSETSGGCVYDGLPLKDVDVTISGDGEILIAGPSLATGYLDEQLTADKFVQREGTRWYRTGDAGSIDGGRVMVSGRMDRVIISGGLKVSLDAVEDAARAVHGIDQAYAVNIPDSEWGERPAVIAQVNTDVFAEASHKSEGENSVYAAVYDAVEADLGRVAAPKRVVTVEYIPLLESGKPDYVTMRSLAARDA